MVSVEDRAFLFADAVYEAVPVYSGKCFLPEQHMSRLASGLTAIGIEFDVREFDGVSEQLVDRNDLTDVEFSLFYMQVTRGVAPRTHAFPTKRVPPTVYAFAKKLARATPNRWAEGYAAITVPDQRWGRANIKSTGLLPNVLAQQSAVVANVEDAIFIRDGMVMEGTHNNVFAVLDGVIITSPATNHILHGVTRDFVIELAQELDLPMKERSFTVDELYAANEIFFTGTTTEVRPTVEIDGRTVGDGSPGPVTQLLSEAYTKRVDKIGLA